MKKQSLRTIVLIGVGFIAGLAVIIPAQLLSNSTTPASNTPTTKSKETGKPLNVTIALAREEIILDGIRAVGTILPSEHVDLSAEISGKVSAILFKEGQYVKKGQSLVKINDDDLQAKMQRYIHQERTLAEKLERQQILLAKEAVSQEAYDMVETEYNVLKADIAVLEVDIKRSTVRAPFDGIIGLRYISEGAYVQPTTRIAQMVDQSELLIEFSIPEKYSAEPLVGKTIYFTVEGNSTRHKARIYAIEPKIDEATRSIIIRAEYVNSSGKVRPGMSARITIPTSGETKRLLIPSQTIVPTMTGKSVWAVVDNRATERVITTGARLESDVEVLTGLNLGDTIIVNGIMHVRENMPVVIK